MAQFVLKVQDIDAEGRSYRLSIPGTWLASVLTGTDLGAVVGKDGVAELFAQRSGDDILVTGTLRGTLVAECIRCLEGATLDLTAEVGALFSQALAPRDGPELELDPEDVPRETYDGEQVVLDEVVREQLILEVPMQPLCSEDCPGIAIPEHVKPPADFGASDTQGAVDPRFAALKDITPSGGTQTDGSPPETEKE